jgi:hypothetical protein
MIKDNHYVPQLYLKRWKSSSDQNKIWVYRTLVPHLKMPKWSPKPISGIGYYAHLYTRIMADLETDEFEHWLEHEVETPVEEVMNKVVLNQRLSENDWKKLIRFLAIQYVRTPAWYVRNKPRWEKQVPELIKETVMEGVQKLKYSRNIAISNKSETETLPFFVTVEPSPNKKEMYVKTEVAIGREMWLYNIKRVFNKLVYVLLGHNWAISYAPEGMQWITSDDPVICLNYYGDDKYDFNGGWKNKKTEIFLPLSPQHMMYTKVGSQPFRGQWDYRYANLVQKLIAEHAYRFIFASEPIDEIQRLRPRLIGETAFKNDKEMWKRWHYENSSIEKKIISARSNLS